MHAGDKVLNEQEVRGGVQTVDLHAYGGGSAWSLLALFVDGFHCDSMQHRHFVSCNGVHCSSWAGFIAVYNFYKYMIPSPCSFSLIDPLCLAYLAKVVKKYRMLGLAFGFP
jgi:hypothetical protein